MDGFSSGVIQHAVEIADPHTIMTIAIAQGPVAAACVLVAGRDHGVPGRSMREVRHEKSRFQPGFQSLQKGNRCTDRYPVLRVFLRTAEDRSLFHHPPPSTQ